jgi:hypothetical protein
MRRNALNQLRRGKPTVNLGLVSFTPALLTSEQLVQRVSPCELNLRELPFRLRDLVAELFHLGS